MDKTLVNLGVIAHGAADSATTGQQCRTIIATGLGRSGTSMVAALLMEAGVHLGTFLADAVHEDQELMDLISRGDRLGLQRAIRTRDTAHDVWGFKLPNLHRYLHHGDIGLFRNARLIIPFRDLAAVAVRHAIAEHWDAFEAMTDIADGTVALLHFARLTGRPVLLLSYEKALAFPDETIDQIIAFCGLPPDAAARARMRDCIIPNNADYAAQARRTYEGVIERLDEDGRLVGWCRQVNEITPVRLQLMAAGTPLACFDACQPRPDLLEAGFGNGNHGFAQPLDLAALPPAAPLHLRVLGTTWELAGSGRCVGDLLFAPAPAPPALPPAAPVPAARSRPPARRVGPARANNSLRHAKGFAEQRDV